MGKDKKPPSKLVLAAEELEAELDRAEVLSRAVRRIRLDGEKNLNRAAEELGQLLSLPERLGERLNALSTAMSELQARQLAALEPLAAFAGQVQQRQQLFGTHMQVFAELGKAAGILGADLGSSEVTEMALAEADGRLQQIAELARSLAEAARVDDFPELAEQADVLKQQMTALRKRLPPRGSA
jgi:hypothetical protein